MTAEDAERLRRAGLCASCRQARALRTPRGSEFWLCERSRREPAFAKYPALPVLRCAGYERSPAAPR